MKRKLFTILLCGIMTLGFVGCSNDNEQNENNNNEPSQEQELGSVQKETVNDLIAKYNTEIMDSGLGTPAYDDYMMVENGNYWFALTDDIIFYVTPVECSEDKMKDIVDFSAVRIDKEKFNEETITNYAKKLIKANNNDFSDEEMDALMQEAKKLKKDKLMANNGKGIFVGIYENDEFYEYQVKRIYEK